MLILKQNAANTVPTPPAGKGTIFLNSSDDLAVKTSSGNVAAVPTISGANTQVYFNDTGTLGANANLTFDSSTNVLTTPIGNISTLNSGLLQNGNSNVTITANGNVTVNAVGGARITATSTGANVTGTLGVSGNANVGNLGAAQVLATANITTPQIISNVTTGTAPLVVSSTTVVSNLNADLLDGFNSASGNTASTVAVRDASGNLAANFFIGNGSQLSGIITSVSNVSNGNSNVNIPAANGNVNITAVGNATIVVTGTGANITGTANITGNANVGNLGTGRVIATGNITGTQVLATGNVLAPQLISNVSTGTAPFVVSSTTKVNNLYVARAETADIIAAGGVVGTGGQTVAPNVGGTGLSSPGTSGNVLTSNGTAWTSTAPAPGAGSLQANASGTLVTGATVIVNPSGTVSICGPSTGNLFSGNAVQFSANAGNFTSATYHIGQQKVVVAYVNGATGNSEAVVGTVSGNSITFGTAAVFANISVGAITATYANNVQKVIIAYTDQTTGPPYNQGKARVATVTGNAISFGNVATFFANSIYNPNVTYDYGQNRAVIAFVNQNNGNLQAIAGEVSGTDITFGPAAVFGNGYSDSVATSFYAAQGRPVIAYATGSNTGNVIACIVDTFSGNTISFGTPAVFQNSQSRFISIGYDSGTEKLVLVTADGFANDAGYTVVASLNDTTFTVGNRVPFPNNSNTFSTAIASYSSGMIISYNDANANAYGSGTAVPINVVGNSLSYGTTVVFSNAYNESLASTYDSTLARVVTINRVSGVGNAYVFSANVSNNLTAENFIGFSNNNYSNGNTATVQVVGAVANTSQSNLTPGQSYYVQLDGTLGLSPASPSVFAGTAVAANRIIVKG